jgi:hypothetical protein
VTPSGQAAAARAQGVFLDYLPRLRQALLRAQEALPAAVWASRLAPDMTPLLEQAEMAVNFALRTHAALLAQPVRWGPAAGSPEGVLRRLEHAIAVWQRPPSPVVGTCEDGAGRAVHRAPPDAFVDRYALPNYLFHHTLVHALLRHAGLGLGKADFDGIHAY